jgi:hypothetical protein
MRVNTFQKFPFERALYQLCPSIPRITALRLWLGILCLFGVVLGLLPGTIRDVEAASHTDSRVAVDIDSRWLPWIGSWRLVSETVDTADEKQGGDFVLRISPGDERNTVKMKAFQGKTVLFEDAIVTNGLSQPLKNKKCSGWFQYSWSETGKRLLFESKSSCPDEPLQKISGLSIINEYGEWLDIQLLQRGDDRVITLRRYSPVPDSARDAGQYKTGEIHPGRVSAGTGFSIDEVVELSRKVAPEVLEAAMVEYYEPFPIDSKTLVYLSDSGVSSHIVDLMVALSYPEKFSVEPQTVSIAPRDDSAQSGGDVYYVNPPYGSYYIFDPYFPWYWSPYTYSLYWGSGWGVWPGYYAYYPSRIYRDRSSSGRLVAGHGYTRIDQRRYARPKSGGAVSAPTSVIRNSRSGAISNARVYSNKGISGSVSSPTTSGSRRIVSPPSSSGRVSSAPSGGGVRVSAPSGGRAPSASSGGGTSNGSSGRKAKHR